jgi:hypothetical protein
MKKHCCNWCGRRVPEAHHKCAKCRARLTASIKAAQKRSLSPTGRRRKMLDDKEPTAAEIEKMIAEQMRCLPDWWDKEKRDGGHSPTGPRVQRVFAIVAEEESE